MIDTTDDEPEADELAEAGLDELAQDGLELDEQDAREQDENAALESLLAVEHAKARAEFQAELDAERRENARLRSERTATNGGGNLSFKVSEKGALSVYGLGRFPVSLYKGQWDRLLANAPAIAEYRKRHDGLLSDKPAK